MMNHTIESICDKYKIQYRPFTSPSFTHLSAAEVESLRTDVHQLREIQHRTNVSCCLDLGWTTSMARRCVEEIERRAREIEHRARLATVIAAEDADFERKIQDVVALASMPRVEELSVDGGPISLARLLKQVNLAPSTTEALRMIDQGGVRLNDEVVHDRGVTLQAGVHLLQVGKRKIARVTLHDKAAVRIEHD